jgi:DNA-binding NtrC family response regulator
MNTPIMIASSDLESRQALNRILVQEGYETICASRISECLEVLSQQEIALIFCERHLADGSYRDLLKGSRPLNQKLRVVVTSRQADWDEYKEALQTGAFDLIMSPCQPTDVLWTIIHAKKDEYERSHAMTRPHPVAMAATA